MKKKYFLLSLCLFGVIHASTPLWTFTPLTATTINVPGNGSASIQYQVTNQSSRSHTLVMRTVPGITQTSSGIGICGNPFILASHASCTLSLNIDGSQLSSVITDGPIICEQGSNLQCYRPSANDIMHITPTTPISSATIYVSNSPLTLTTNGPVGTLIITNTSLSTTAVNVLSDFNGTALDGNVIESSNTCASIAPQASCTISYTPGSAIVTQTAFPIDGTNTNTVIAYIAIDSSVQLSSISPNSGPASGGTAVTISGSGLTGATGVNFDGIAATSVNVVNSSTITAITPAHSVGSVDVIVTTPSGSATLNNAYTYLTTAIGAAAFGGTIACLNGGSNNLIAAFTDNSSNIPWGGFGILTFSNSATDGSGNTATITSVLGPNGGLPYAAQLCRDYQIDSQGNSPCQSGNTCYSDWFLPAGNNTSSNGQLNCVYTNKVAIGGFSSSYYWSSSEFNPSMAWGQNFSTGFQGLFLKGSNLAVRCVRGFTP